MIIKFNCKCGNNNPSLTYEYDGCLGYEAIVCKICGSYCDHFGDHSKDEWSEQFIVKDIKTKI